MGWWVGKWKGRGVYEGDELELMPDGSFKSEGTANIDDGSIWVNLADGTLNLKRDPKAGSMEGMTKDYHMTYKFKDMAKIDGIEDYQEFFLTRIDKPEPGMEDDDEDVGAKGQTHIKKICD